MAIAIVNTTNATVAAAGTTGITVTKPGSLANGHVMYAFISRTDYALTNKWTCSGWTDISPATHGSATGNDTELTILRKVVTNAGGEPANYTFVNTHATSYQICGFIVALSGVNNTTPEDITVPAYGFNSNAPNPASLNATSATATAFVIAVLQESLLTAAAVTPVAPSTYTLITNGNANSATGSLDNQTILASKTLGAAGSTTGTNAWANTGTTSTVETLTAVVLVRSLDQIEATVSATWGGLGATAAADVVPAPGATVAPLGLSSTVVKANWTISTRVWAQLEVQRIDNLDLAVSLAPHVIEATASATWSGLDGAAAATVIPGPATIQATASANWAGLSGAATASVTSPGVDFSNAAVARRASIITFDTYSLPEGPTGAINTKALRQWATQRLTDFTGVAVTPKAQTDAFTSTEASTYAAAETQTDSSTATETFAITNNVSVVTDTLTATEVLALTTTEAKAQTDSSTATETFSIAVTLSQTDTFTATDTATLLTDTFKTQTDTFTATDTLVLTANRAQTDSLVATDTLVLTTAIAPVDTFTATEQTFVIGRSQTDTLTATESISIAVTLTQTDSITESESLANATGSNPVVTDTFTATESFAYTATKAVADSPTASETPTGQATFTVTETVTVSEVVSSQLGAIFDTITATEVLTLVVPRSVTDSAVVASETFSIAVTTSVADSFTESDTFGLLTAPVLETYTATDALALTAAIAPVDTFTESDALSVLRSSTSVDSITVSDTLATTVTHTVTDSASISEVNLTARPVTVTDSATATDVITSVTYGFFVIDNVTFFDIPAILRTLAITDDATIVEIFNTGSTSLAVTDTFVATESGITGGIQGMQVLVPESATVTDSIAVAYAIKPTEAISFTELISVQVTQAITDSSIAVDVAVPSPELTISDSVAIVDSSGTGVSFAVSDAAAVSEDFLYSSTSATSDTAISVDTNTYLTATTVNDTSTISEANNYQRQSTVTDTFTASEVVTFANALQFVDVVQQIEVEDRLSIAATIGANDLATVADALAPRVEHVFAELLSIGEQVIINATLVLLDQIAESELWIRHPPTMKLPVFTRARTHPSYSVPRTGASLTTSRAGGPTFTEPRDD